ncbi:hypothetical protein [Mycoplasmopsis columbina]|uniref:Transmembrane protein n=1 Tax=Mycoplasmopsis columbina SF7 TaxID=1037410 RepID=F9UJN1_9BACT|nr:hypothetical protein [Mycoplasmopsis columbina]EGV00412.1 hypothetical protein MCSF7_00386 [Mycoplasmopsis columbina SF7]VEU76723.1 Uncharacterised protein [Mycoplasmopsis columbina]
MIIKIRKFIYLFLFTIAGILITLPNQLKFYGAGGNKEFYKIYNLNSGFENTLIGYSTVIFYFFIVLLAMLCLLTIIKKETKIYQIIKAWTFAIAVINLILWTILHFMVIPYGWTTMLLISYLFITFAILSYLILEITNFVMVRKSKN